MQVPPPGWSQVSENGQQSGGAGGNIPVAEHLVQLFETDVEVCNVVLVVEVVSDVVEVGCVVVVEVGCVGVVVECTSDDDVDSASVDVSSVVVSVFNGLHTPVPSGLEHVVPK